MRHLDIIQIEDPCPLPWSALQGEGRVKHCGTCDKNVYHLSRMTRDEAETLLRANGDVCVQYYARKDGTVVTADCTPSRLAKARRMARRAMLGAGVMMAGLLVFTMGLTALLLGWVSRDVAAPVVAKLEETRKVLEPMIPLTPPPALDPVEHPHFAGAPLRRVDRNGPTPFEEAGH